MTRRVVFSPEMIQDLSFYTMSKSELQDEAEARGLSKAGTKNDLIERLQDSE
jgi:hypothetical protein